MKEKKGVRLSLIKEIIKDVFDAIINFLKSRAFVLLILFGIMFSSLLYRVFYLQIVKSDYYLENGDIQVDIAYNEPTEELDIIVTREGDNNGI